MSDDRQDNKTRLFETKQGLKSATQEGRPMADYFQNDRLPAGLRRFDVYMTDAGPVVEQRAAIPWSEEHDLKVDQIAVEAKANIEKHGYYWNRALGQLRSLARDTDRPVEKAVDAFHERFVKIHGKEAGEMVDDWRRRNDLPVRDRNAEQSHNHEPEM